MVFSPFLFKIKNALKRNVAVSKFQSVVQPDMNRETYEWCNGEVNKQNQI